MKGLIASLSFVAVVAVSVPGFADTALTAADVSVIRADSYEELTEKFCAASPDVEHILVLPAALFVDSEEIVCDSGPYKLYRLIEHDDADDFEYFFDPPFGDDARLGCDGKAGRTMEVIAVNCRPL